jgi:uncharacterized membrane protein YfhO
VILTDDFYPGWTATLDGRPATIHRVDYLLRGITIGPGRHTVVLDYRPASWRLGLLISALCAFGVLAAVLSGLLTRRRRAPRPPAPAVAA